MEVLRVELRTLRDQIAAVERESAANVRRCAEMQYEIDALKKVVADLSGTSVSR
jgi:hypothetical protein